MKHILIILVFISSSAMGQKYIKESHHIPDQRCSCDYKPTDARIMVYDDSNFVYRPYMSRDEVLRILKPNMRTGMCAQDFQHTIIVNTGGKLTARGVVEGGVNSNWGFIGGYADSNLVQIKQQKQ